MSRTRQQRKINAFSHQFDASVTHVWTRHGRCKLTSKVYVSLVPVS
ncbi:MAG: hypothetical protein SAK29_01310 [Scytonema sp. PMC 1069.18]|nr:hypothetical protein [Scytonema sp. PMC 1069.18]MEC4811913.1 hypothetical protein [Scytonema sp. PMC 1069.18]MEC4884984.1 hypothetical protein [Scytonema sp. PMC 1070.18]